MPQDEIVAEIRKHREAHTAQCNYDLDVIYKAFKEAEARSAHQKLSFPPRRIEYGSQARKAQ